MSTRTIRAGERLFKQYVTRAEPTGEGRRVRFTITTSAVDREGDIVDPAGIQLDNYMRNPVVLWSHDHKTPAIARTVRIDRVDGGLVAEAEFAPAADHPLAEQVYRLITGGFIRGASIGFKPITWAYNERRGGIDFQEIEVIEWSCCNVPANPEALVAASKAGIDTVLMRAWARDILTRGDDDVLRLVDDDEPFVTLTAGEPSGPAYMGDYDYDPRFTRTRRRDVALPSEQTPAVPGAVAHARSDLVDFLGSLGEEGLRPRYDGLRAAIAELDAWLEPLRRSGGRSRDDVFDVDASALPGAIADALRNALAPIVLTETARAIRDARGRID